jgi:hypothetical protein
MIRPSYRVGCFAQEVVLVSLRHIQPAIKTAVCSVATLAVLALAACGSGGSSNNTTTTTNTSAAAPPATDLKSTVQAALNAKPLTRVVGNLPGCNAAQAVGAFGNIPDAHIVSHGDCITAISWHGPDVKPFEVGDKYRVLLIIGHYVADTVGEPVVYQGTVYSIPLNTHFEYSASGKILAANGPRAGQIALDTPHQMNSVLAEKRADGTWNVEPIVTQI